MFFNVVIELSVFSLINVKSIRQFDNGPGNINEYLNRNLTKSKMSVSTVLIVSLLILTLYGIATSSGFKI